MLCGRGERPPAKSLKGASIRTTDDKVETAPEAEAGSRFTTGEATRRRLQQVALDLFRERGYQATTTRDVAAVIGVQQASLYYHMKTKEELLHGICRSCFTKVVEGAEAAVADASDPLAAFRAIGRSHLAITLTYQKEFAVSLMECRALGPDYFAEIKALWARYHMVTYDVMDKAKEAGTLRSDLPNKYMYVPLMCTLNWSVMWFRPGRGLTVPELNDIFEVSFFQGNAPMSLRRQFREAPPCRDLQLKAELVTSRGTQSNHEMYAKLLDAACALFARKGYHGTSLREIADALGIQKASLYYYIKSKEDLLYEISKAAIGHISACVKDALTQVNTPAERLYAFIVAHVSSLLEHQNWHAAANEELLTFPADKRDKIVALRDEYEAQIRDLLHEAQQAGVLRSDISVKTLGMVLFGMITNIYPWYQPAIDLPPRQLGLTLADLFMTGVVPFEQL